MTNEEIACRLQKLRDTYVSVWPARSTETLDAAIERLDPQPPTDCVRVRVAVAVDAGGEISAYALQHGMALSKAMDLAVKLLGLDPITHQAFIVADIPRIPTVQARIVEAEK